MIRIPPDFTARVLSGKQAKVEFSKKENSLSAESAMIELRLARALIRMNSHLLTAMTRGASLSEREVRQAQEIAPTVLLDARFAGRKPAPVGFGFSLPGNMVMYLMMNLLIFGGTSLAIQRQNGIVRRLACHPLTRTQMIAGKIYGLVLLGAAQVAVMLLAGRFLFGLRFGGNLWAILLTLLVYVWVAGSLGVLIGSLLRAEDKVIGVAVLSSLLMAALGGCWWPLEIGPPVLRTIAHCFPTGWALDALHQLISFGGGLSEAARPIAALGSFGLVANALAAWLFRW
jgi:ABC-type multidrug transport system permease subunit